MATKSLFQQVRNNKTKSVFIMLLFFVVICFLGVVIGTVYSNMYTGFFLALFAASFYMLISYFTGDSMVLAMTGAKEAKKSEHPHLVHTIEGLAIAAGVPTPKIYVINDTALNAFATGRDPKHASVTVTTGLLDKLNREELEGVIAHEMSHIKNYDIRFMLICVICVGIIVLLSDFLLRSFLWGGGKDSDNKGNAHVIIIVIGLILAILAPLIGKLIQLAVSRRREYLADANGAVLTRYPQGLANALKKISKDPDPLVDHANRATAHLFISTPFKKKTGWTTNLFATHPPLEDRIKRLEEM